MHLYEALFILRPDLSELKVKETIDRFKESLESQGGRVIKVDEWGMRDLAYPVKKHNKGIYVLFDCEAEPSAMRELDRRLRLSDDALRHILVRKAVARGGITQDPDAAPTA